MDMKQYQSEAHVTASTSFFGSFVGIHNLLDKLEAAIIAISEVDKIKKQLFYGRNIASIGPVASVAELNMTEQEQAIFHALIGAGTEGGECLELLRDFVNSAINENPTSCRQQIRFDHTKVMEELGGAMWYIPIGAQAMGVTMEDIAKLNIGQLRVRYAGKFEAYEANNRNLAAENLRLEQLSGHTAANSELSGELSASEKSLHVLGFPGPIDGAMPVLTEQVQYEHRVTRQPSSTTNEEKQHYIGQTFDPNC